MMQFDICYSQLSLANEDVKIVIYMRTYTTTLQLQTFEPIDFLSFKILMDFKMIFF